MKYVVGFVFDFKRDYVLLIRKNRPAWQLDKLNGVGGKIEDGEHPARAMWREFQEETGYWIDPDEWREVAQMVTEGNVVHFFGYVTQLTGPEFQKKFDHASPTDETLEVWPVDEVRGQAMSLGAIPNLAWLVPLAAYTHDLYVPPTFVELDT